MKKTLAILLALALCFGVFSMTMAEETEVPVETEIVEESFETSIEYPEYRTAIAHEARYALMILCGLNASFSGAPDAEIAWNALASYATMVADDQQYFTANDLAAMYTDLFAEGSFTDIMTPANAQFVAEGDGYRFQAYDPETTTEISVNDTDTYAADEKTMIAEVSATARSNISGSESFIGNTYVELTPTDVSTFGAQVLSVTPASRPAFAEAEASVTLRDMDGNNYYAANVLDGELNTCWAFPAAEMEDAKLTLLFDAPTEMHGLLLTPGYAKSAYAFSSNRRVAAIKVTLDNGEVYDMSTLDDFDKDDYTGMTAFYFGSCQEVSSLTIEVTGTFDGSKFDDVCISEVEAF